MPEKYLIIPALCSYAYSTHYAQNYASIIRKTLVLIRSVVVGVAKVANNWASEASPTLGCSIEISRDISICVCRMSNHVESRESNTRMLKVSIGR